MVWGTLADRIGRRPMMLGCLFVLSLACIGLALVPTTHFWLLMVLRCLQAVGSASTLTIGRLLKIIYCVVYLISYRCWNYFGHRYPCGARWFLWHVYSGSTGGPEVISRDRYLISKVGPALGPVIGGILADKLGWR